MVSISKTTIYSLRKLLLLAAVGVFIQPHHASGISVTAVQQWVSTKLWGSPVSPETDTLCRSLLKEAGIADVSAVEIRSFDSSLIPGSLAVSIGPKFRPLLKVNEQFLHGLPPEQQRFALGHEAIHIKNNHVLKSVSVWLALLSLQLCMQVYFTPVYKKLIDTISPESLKEALKSDTAEGVARILLYITTFIIPLVGYKWFIELEATREGTKALNCVDGALAYLTPACCTHAEPTTITESMRKTIRWCIRWLNHPPLSWHAAEVKKLVQS